MIVLYRAHHRYWLLLLVLLCTGVTRAVPDFPALTGRVVDDAGLLSGNVQQQLQQQLAQHEDETSNQVVVVTLPSLQGYAIDDYGYQLGRHWGIGQGERDNGVLLIVAPNEREVRIEVGYGLEGALTDAGSHAIIQDVILPPFRDNDYEAGIQQGVDAILGSLQGTYEPVARKPAADPERLFMLFVILISIGEGFASFSIASPTGEGLTRPRTFSRVRRVTVVGALRYVCGDLEQRDARSRSRGSHDRVCFDRSWHHFG